MPPKQGGWLLLWVMVILLMISLLVTTLLAINEHLQQGRVFHGQRLRNNWQQK